MVALRRIGVAAVQSGIDPDWTPVEWRDHLRWQLASCREAGVHLAVFPAWSGVYRESFPDGFPLRAFGTLLRLMGDLAREASLYLIPGTIPLRYGNGEIRLSSPLLGPAGEFLGMQEEIGPPPGYASGEGIAVFTTPWGRIGIAVDNDAAVPEIGRILALRGAEIVCHPAAHPAPFKREQWTLGLPQLVEANLVIGLEAPLVGSFAGKAHEGLARVLAPAAMTRDGSGILACTADFSRTEILVAEVDLDELEPARRASPIFGRFNLDLYRRTLPAAYRRLAASATGQGEEAGADGRA